VAFYIGHLDTFYFFNFSFPKLVFGFQNLFLEENPFFNILNILTLLAR